MADRLITLQQESVQARFWEKVNVSGPDDCWDWNAYLDRHGYGRFKYHKNRQVTASRAALIINDNSDPLHLHALHSCDRPICANPNHLRWGTIRDNCDDKVARGRVRSGDTAGFSNPRCTITPQQLAQIVEMIDAGRMNNKQIGRAFSLTHSMISRIRQGRSWVPQVAEIRLSQAGNCSHD